MPSTITVRCTEEEHKQISEKAKQYGMSLSEYIRFVSLNAEVKVRAEK